MGLMQLMVQLGINATAYQTGLKQAQGAAQDFGQKVTSQLGNRLAGIFTLGAMEEGIRKTVQFGSKIQDLHERTGISTDDLQKFDFAAGQTGTSLEAMVKGVERLGISMAKAKAGDSGLMASLQRLGLSEAQVQTLSAAEAFRVLGDSVAGMSEITGAVQSDLRDTMGRGALELIPAMQNGIRALGDEMAMLGGVIDAEMIAKLDNFGDKMALTGTLSRSVIASMVGGLQEFGDKAIQFGQAFLTANAFAFSALLKGENPLKAFKEGFKEERTAAKAQADTEAQMQKDRAEKRKGRRPEDLEDEKKQKAEQRELEQVARIRERIAEIQRKTHMEGMTNAEKLRQIEEEIALKKARLLEGGPQMSEVNKAKAELELAELEGERKKLSQAKGKDIVLKPDTGAGISIGNIFGVDPNRPVVDKLEVIHLDLVKVVSKLGGDRGTTPTEEYPP